MVYGAAAPYQFGAPDGVALCFTLLGGVWIP